MKVQKQDSSVKKIDAASSMTLDETHSQYSGGSGLASLESRSINYFQVVQEEEYSDRLNEESGESGDSEDTNSLNPEGGSDHEYFLIN